METRAQAMEKRKTEWRKQSEENSCSLLSHFWSTSWSPFFSCYIPFESLGSQEIQHFKPCMIWSWNEEDMAFGRQLHHVKWPISQGEFHIAKISQWDFLHGAKFCHFAPWRATLRKFRKGIFFMVRNFAISHHEETHCENFARRIRHIAKFLWIPCFETLLMLFHYRFSKIFCLIFSFVNTYFTLVINQWIGCFCNSSCLFIVKVRFHMLIMEWTSYIK